jgi:hypothetical protein
MREALTAIVSSNKREKRPQPLRAVMQATSLPSECVIYHGTSAAPGALTP